MQRMLVGAASMTLMAAGVWWAAPPAEAAPPMCGGRAATIVGTSASEVIQGTGRADVIVGRGGNDIIDGRGGDDWVCGNAGSDRLSGSGGADRLFGGTDWVHMTDEGTTERVGDSLAGGAGDDRLAPGPDSRTADEVIHDSITWESSVRGVHVDTAAGVATGQGRDVFVRGTAWMIGSAFADVFEGGPSRDLFSGGRGPDRFLGRGADDRIVTDPGDSGGVGAADVVFGGDGDDRISAGGGQDLLRGGPGDDVIDASGPAAARMYGGPGADMLFTQLTDDPGRTQVVDGGPGRRDFVDLHTQVINPSTLDSTAAWNMATGRLVFRLDHPVISTVAHVERVDLSAWGTTWTIRGTSRADSVGASGSWGTAFIGLSGDDTFWGSSYADTFEGGPGHDHSRGMAGGIDTCRSVELLDEADCENVTP